MSIQNTLIQRANSRCELCNSPNNLSVYEVPPVYEVSVDSANSEKCLLACNTCTEQLKHNQALDVNHWHCLNESMWSPVPAVQITAWRILKRLSAERWAQDLFDMLYLDTEMLAWAEAIENDTHDEPTLDSNATRLNTGDTVTLIKDLDVKGAHFTAKRGTTVKNIALTSNPQQVEGRVNGTRIVLLSKFLKKSN